MKRWKCWLLAVSGAALSMLVLVLLLSRGQSPFRFLEGRTPVIKMSNEVEQTDVYRFKGDYEQIARAAEKELEAGGWSTIRGRSHTRWELRASDLTASIKIVRNGKYELGNSGTDLRITPAPGWVSLRYDRGEMGSWLDRLRRSLGL